MRKGDSQLGTPYVEYTNTKANIEALTGIGEGATAYATDTDELGSYTGAAWKWTLYTSAIDDTAYGAGWDTDTTHAPSKNAVYDKIETLGGMVVAIVDTEAVILATSAATVRVAYGTDTQFFYVADGTSWRRASLKFYTDSENPDMGHLQNNSKDGYYAAFITNKALINCTIGTNPSTSEGGIWVSNAASPNGLKIYLNGAIQTLIVDFSLTLGYLVHYPFSTTQAIRVASGNSLQVGINGRPLVQDYDTCMGSHPAPKVLNGGTY